MSSSAHEMCKFGRGRIFELCDFTMFPFAKWLKSDAAARWKLSTLLRYRNYYALLN